MCSTSDLIGGSAVPVTAGTADEDHTPLPASGLSAEGDLLIARRALVRPTGVATPTETTSNRVIAMDPSTPFHLHQRGWCVVTGEKFQVFQDSCVHQEDCLHQQTYE
jgi:hypothetical protein